VVFRSAGSFVVGLLPLFALAWAMFLLDRRCAEALAATSRLPAPPDASATAATREATLVSATQVLREGGTGLTQWLSVEERAEVLTKGAGLLTAALPVPPGVPDFPAELGASVRIAARPLAELPPGTTAAGGGPLPGNALYVWSPTCGTSGACADAHWLADAEARRQSLAAGLATFADWARAAGVAEPTPLAPVATQACAALAGPVVDALAAWPALGLCSGGDGALTPARLAGPWFGARGGTEASGPRNNALYVGPAPFATSPTRLSNVSRDALGNPLSLAEPALGPDGAIIGAYARAMAVLVELRDNKGVVDASILAAEPWLAAVPDHALPSRLLYLYFTDSDVRGQFVIALTGDHDNGLYTSNAARILLTPSPNVERYGLHFVSAANGGHLLWRDVDGVSPGPGETRAAGLLLTVVQP
jgi:hypothetical protein